MTAPTPLVSVVIPAYGVAPYIGDALASVFAQTSTSWEAIVINDGSPDTPALEAALAPFLDRIVYWAQDNQGAAAARNAGIRLAKGEWLAFLDGDDRWEPRFLEAQLAFLATNRLDMAWSDGWIIGETPDAGRRIMEVRPCQGEVTVEALLRQSVSVGTSATVVRRIRVEQVGGFDVTQLRAQDFDLWVRLVHAGVRAGYNPEPLIHYRVRGGNLSGDAIQQAARAIAVCRHLQAKQFLGPDAGAVLARRIQELEASHAILQGKEALLQRHYRVALGHFRRAGTLRNTWKIRLVRVAIACAPALARWVFLRFAKAGAG